MMSLCWKWFVPLSFAAFLLTALWLVVPMGRTAQLLISLLTFLGWGVLMTHFVRRVQHNLRAARVPLHLNPFL